MQERKMSCKFHDHYWEKCSACRYAEHMAQQFKEWVFGGMKQHLELKPKKEDAVD